MQPRHRRRQTLQTDKALTLEAGEDVDDLSGAISCPLGGIDDRDGTARPIKHLGLGVRQEPFTDLRTVEIDGRVGVDQRMECIRLGLYRRCERGAWPKRRHVNDRSDCFRSEGLGSPITHDNGQIARRIRRR